MYVAVFKVASSISDFVNYVMCKIGSEVIFSSISPDQATPTEDPQIVLEFCEDFMENHGKNAISHLIITCDDPKVGEDKALWKMITQDALDMMNLSHVLRVIVLHRDGGSPHVHGILTFFKIEFVLGEASFKEEEFNRVSNREFNKKYKANEQKLKNVCKETSRKLEEKYGLKRDTMNIHVGKDRYLQPELSIKYHLKIAFHELLQKVTSLNEFLKDLPAVCQKHLQNWKTRMLHKPKSPMLNLIGNDPQVQCEVTKSPVKQFSERILLRVGNRNFKISDYKIGKGLDLASVKERVERNIKSASDTGKAVFKKLNRSARKLIQGEIKPRMGSFISNFGALEAAFYESISEIRPKGGGGADTSAAIVTPTLPKNPFTPMTGTCTYENSKVSQSFKSSPDSSEKVTQGNPSNYEDSNAEPSVGYVVGLRRKSEIPPKETSKKTRISEPSIGMPINTPNWIEMAKGIPSNHLKDYEYELEKRRRKKAEMERYERDLKRRNSGTIQPFFEPEPEMRQKGKGLSR